MVLLALEKTELLNSEADRVSRIGGEVRVQAARRRAIRRKTASTGRTLFIANDFGFLRAGGGISVLVAGLFGGIETPEFSILNIQRWDTPRPVVQQTEVGDREEERAPVGSVVSLWRYPVKSMMGEELNASYVSDRGLLGDRAYALVDQITGKVASAKNPRKWGRLFDFRASFVDPPKIGGKIPAVRITLPDGRLTLSDKPEASSLLSEALRAQIRLMTSSLEKPSYEEYWPDIEGLANREKVTEELMPPQTFFDLATIHVLTTATMDRLRELYPQGRFEVRRFRPNVVVEPSPAVKDFVENTWVHRTLAIGEEVRLRVTGPCTRCVMTTLAQGDLPRDLGILRAAARYNQVNVGVYASVKQGGNIKRGDHVWVE